MESTDLKSIRFSAVQIAANLYQEAGIYAINTALLDPGKKLDPTKILKELKEEHALFYQMGINGHVNGMPSPITYIPGSALSTAEKVKCVLGQAEVIYEYITTGKLSE